MDPLLSGSIAIGVFAAFISGSLVWLLVPIMYYIYKLVITSEHPDLPSSFPIDKDWRDMTAEEIAAHPDYDLEEDGTVCQPPTVENPMGNLMHYEIGQNPTRPPACSDSHPATKKAREAAFYKSHPSDDPWQLSITMRQWHTMPSTTAASDRDTFAQWLFGDMSTCKDGDTSKCLKYTDLRGIDNQWAIDLAHHREMLQKPLPTVPYTYVPPPIQSAIYSHTVSTPGYYTQ